MLIVKNNDKKNVTKGAYEQFYKPLGYKPVITIPFEEKKEEIINVEKEERTVSQKKTPKKYKK